MSKQQTAVEWLVEKMLKEGYFEKDKPLTFTNLDHLVHEAKQMEKEQIIYARMDSMTDDELSYTTAEDYYNQTYGGEK